MEAEAWKLRRQRDEYKREADHYRRIVVDVQNKTARALYEGNAT